MASWLDKKWKEGTKYSTQGRLNTKEAIRAVNTGVGREALQPYSEEEKSVIADSQIAVSFTEHVREQNPFAEEGVSGDFYRYGGANAAGERALQARTAVPFLDKPASLRIVQRGEQGGDFSPLPRYTKFLMQSCQESHFERYQIIETFNDFYVFMFGEKPPIYSFSGTLINTESFNWVQDFMLLYEAYFRGTRCVESDSKAIITFGNRQMEGYILNVSSQTQAQSEEGVPFSFQMVITKRTYLGLSIDFDAVTQGGTSGFANILESTIKQIASKEGKGSSSATISTGFNGVSDAVNGQGDISPFEGSASLDKVDV